MIIPLLSKTPIAIGPFSGPGTPTITIYVNGSLISTPGTAQAGVQIGSSGTYIATYTPAGTTDTGILGNILIIGTIGSESISVNVDTNLLDQINHIPVMEGVPERGSAIAITGGGGGSLVPYGSYGGFGVWYYDDGYFWYDGVNWAYGEWPGLTTYNSTDGATGSAWQWGATTATVSPGLGTIFLRTQPAGTAALVNNALDKIASGSVGADPAPSTSEFTVADVVGDIPPFGWLVWESGAANSGQSVFEFNSGVMSFYGPFGLSGIPIAGDRFIIPQAAESLFFYLYILQLLLSSGVQLDLTQDVPISNTAHTVGDALNAARAQGFGKWVFSGTTLTLYAENNTVVQTFDLDSATAPTMRTPTSMEG